MAKHICPAMLCLRRMETFIRAKPMVEDLSFEVRRNDAASLLEKELSAGNIDPPLIDLLRHISKIRHCYTLQSCYGHFVHDLQADDKNTEPIGKFKDSISRVHYRIAYLAFCIENSESGRRFHDDLKKVVEVDPEYMQFGSADWFWKQAPNSYVVQLEPERGMKLDSVWVDVEEALYIESLREKFFAEVKKVVSGHLELLSGKS